MKSKRLLLALALALLVPWAANAQKALPYSYGFENNDLDAEGWTVQKTSPSTGISTSAMHEGSYGFQFNYSERDAYLVSPELSGTGNGVALSFYYKEYSSSYGDEQFYVGYTTDETVTDPSAFTYGDITAASLAWQLYETMLPAGTKKVAIKYVYNDAFYLYLDDFTFEAPSACPKPSGLNFALTQGDGTVATLSWTSDADAWQICLNGDETNLIPATTNPYTLTGLTPETTYTAKVRANCGSEQSGWSNEVTFKPTNAYQLTVNDGTTTNGYVPIYGYYVDNITKSQFIIPAENLADMAWGTINKMTFYAAADKNWGNAQFEVYITETSETTVSELADYTTMTKVMNAASLGISGNQMVVEFDTPYQYMGGNLMIGFLQTVTGTYSSCSWYGVSATGASMGGYGSSIYQQNFLPKTTFDYEPGEEPSCYKPTGLAVEYTGGTSATFTWTENGTATSWDLQYSTDAEFTTYTQQQVDGTPTYELTGLELATTYYVRVNAFCGTPSDYSNIVSFTTDMCMPENQCEITFELTDSYGDGWNNAYIAVVDVATGKELARMSADNHGGGGVSYTDTKTLSVCDGREIQFVWHTGSFDDECSFAIKDINEEEIVSGSSSVLPFNYTVNCTVITCRRPTNLAASEIGNRSAVLSWTENGEATEWVVEITDVVGGQITEWNASANPYTIVGLEPETDYSVRVRPVCSDFDDKWSTAITFTTEVACPAPTNVAVSNIEPFNATISWNGTAENYNIRYRTARGFNYGFETAEGFVVDEFPPCTTYDGDGLPTYGIDGYTMPNNTANYVGSVVSFNEYWAAHSGNVMGVFMDAIPDTEAGITANDDYFITPALTIAAGDHFIFWARSITANYGLERMKVGIYGGNGTISTYFAGSADTYVEVPVDWTKYDYDLTAYVGQTIQLAINCVSADAFALLFDDLFVGDPTDDTWDQTLTNVTSPYTLTGLTDETMYEVQVQAACGGEDGVSVWVDGGTFTTPSNCGAPTNLAANDVTVSSATLSWEGFHDSYNLQYRTPASRETYYFNDFNDEQSEGWTWSEYWIYGYADPIYNISGSENYFMQMGWNSTAEETIISCELPAYERGAYVEFYYFGYQVANTFQVGYSTTTNDAEAFTWGDPIDAPLATYTRYQETLADGVKYVAFKATASSQNACVFIDDFGIFGADIPAGAWQTRNAVTSPYSLTGLANDTEYEWQVQGINTACEGGVTEWSNMANFTTLNACMVPVIDSVNNVEATTATVYWTGNQESYNVRYGSFETATSINFNDGVIPASMTNDDTYPWTIVDGHIQSGNAGVASSTSSISFTTTLASDGVITFDAMFRGEGSGQYIWDKCIFSIDGTQQFSYGAVGEEWYNMAYIVAAGTHTFTWSYSKDSSTDPEGDFFAIDNIKIQLHNTTWTTVENVAGNSYDMTGLAPESVIAVQVQGVNDVCDGGVTEWSSEYLFITPEQTLVTQTTELGEGWNWFSTYIDASGDQGQNILNQLKECLGTNGLQIRTQGGGITYRNGRWLGSITINNVRGYQIKTSAPVTITITGTGYANPEECEITINENWNWIGYPVSESQTVTNAFAGFQPNTNDQIKTSGGGATYRAGRWMPNSFTLEPGKSYLYKSSSTEQKTLVFPNVNRKAETMPATVINKTVINKKVESKPVQKAKGINKEFKSINKINNNLKIK